MPLRAMVLGAGSAGEGHALALRQAGVELVAIASRTAKVVRRVADDLGIAVATTDWRAALADCARTSSPSPRPATATRR